MTSEKIKKLKEDFDTKTPKQLRTIRNGLNNRIKSFEDEISFGKALPKISGSHMFFGLELLPLKDLREYVLKKIKNNESVNKV